MAVYLDHNATTPLLPEAAEAMADAAARFGNPASAHGFGQEAASTVDAARRRIAGFLGGEPDEILFTASGTESVQTALLGACRARAAAGRHVVVGAIEHAAGIEAARFLADAGWAVSRAPSDADGRVLPGAVGGLLREDTALVSVLHANNETGVLQPVAEIAALCRDRGIPMHTDAVQSVGKVPVRVDALGVDYLSLAPHKFGGPKGTGALWIRRRAPLAPLLPGAQERGLRGGTLNVPAIAGFAAAVEAAARRGSADAVRMRELRDRLETRTLREIPGARLTGAGAERLPNTAHFTFGGPSGEDLVLQLDLAGYAVSAGSACASGSTEPSHVLTAMGYSTTEARSALRVSLGPSTTREHIDGFTAALRAILAPAPERTR